jgi:large subunit ribosomal protein L15
MPLQRRLPKRGFTNIFRKHYTIVNLSDLKDITPDEKVTPERLVQLGYIKNVGDGLKVLGGGELEVALTIAAHRFSKSALEKIKKAGGTAEVISA